MISFLDIFWKKNIEDTIRRFTGVLLHDLDRWLHSEQKEHYLHD